MCGRALLRRPAMCRLSSLQQQLGGTHGHCSASFADSATSCSEQDYDVVNIDTNQWCDKERCEREKKEKGLHQSHGAVELNETSIHTPCGNNSVDLSPWYGARMQHVTQHSLATTLHVQQFSSAPCVVKTWTVSERLRSRTLSVLDQYKHPWRLRASSC